MGHRLDAVRLVVMFIFVVIYNVSLCLIGDTLTTRFEKVNATLCACSLNEFPSEIQKIIPTMVAITQKPVYIEGFMNVRCTREVLQKVQKHTMG